jgi:protein-S-isoprenylcysteine O-methyltransferase Ste14
MATTSTVTAANLRDLQRKRKQVLVVLVAVAIMLLAVTDSSWRVEASRVHRALQWSGLLLILFCILGRTWCTLYIGGQKKRELVTKGPYSVVRNPLYVFSIFGTAGIGALSGSMVIALLYGACAAVVFYLVVRQEEIFLQTAFPHQFTDYMARTPRFWPRLAAWQDADELVVKPHLVHRTFLDASLFLAAVPLIAVKAVTRDLGWLPMLLHLP